MLYKLPKPMPHMDETYINLDQLKVVGWGTDSEGTRITVIIVADMMMALPYESFDEIVAALQTYEKPKSQVPDVFSAAWPTFDEDDDDEDEKVKA